MIKLSIIDRDQILLLGYKKFFLNFSDLSIGITATSVEEFIAINRRKELIYDSILIDIRVDIKNAIDEIVYMRNLFPFAKILVHADKAVYEVIINCFKSGANAYIVKEEKLNGLYQAVKDVEIHGAYISPVAAKTIAHFLQRRNNRYNLHSDLTNREKQLIQLVIRGMSYKEMASFLNISHYTVNHHLKKLYLKMDVSSKTELVYKFISSEEDQIPLENI